MWLFTKEAATGITRTVVPFIYGGLINWIPPVGDWFEAIGFDQATATIILGGLLYSAIRALAEKWGWLGGLLIFNTKPSY
jgi:hypothetical protein